MFGMFKKKKEKSAPKTVWFSDQDIRENLETVLTGVLRSYSSISVVGDDEAFIDQGKKFVDALLDELKKEPAKEEHAEEVDEAGAMMQLGRVDRKTGKIMARENITPEELKRVFAAHARTMQMKKEGGAGGEVVGLVPESRKQEVQRYVEEMKAILDDPNKEDLEKIAAIFSVYTKLCDRGNVSSLKNIASFVSKNFPNLVEVINPLMRLPQWRADHNADSAKVEHVMANLLMEIGDRDVGVWRELDDMPRNRIGLQLLSFLAAQRAIPASDTHRERIKTVVERCLSGSKNVPHVG